VPGLRRSNQIRNSVLLRWLSFPRLVGSLGVSEPLPELLDARRLAAELGVTRAAAERVMRALPVVTFPELRKTYVKRSDVARLIEERTFMKDELPA
jgi:hypothetical protein